MSNPESKLTSAFLNHQRERLEALRDQYLQDTDQAADEERSLSQLYASEVLDSGDDGANEAQRTTAEAFSAKGELRLGEVRRALEKLAEGSYGLSDESGEAIGRARLDAVPEARFTIEEESLREQLANTEQSIAGHPTRA